MVQNGDIIGMHFPGDTVITYDNGGQYKLTTAYATNAGTFDWGSVTAGNDRDYGIKAHLLPYKDIYFDASVTLNYDSTPQYILTIECTDGKDPVTSTFTVSIVPNEPPTINNLPASCNISEDHIIELLLFRLNVTDPTNDYITCSVTSPASVPFFIKPISGTSDTTSTSSLATGIGQHIFRVISTDNENDQLYHNMTISPNTCPFIIMASGDILSTGNLLGTTTTTCVLTVYVYDGHTLVGPKTLTITITDGFSFISETLNITVIDVNEPPEFHKSYYAVSIDEDLATTKVVDPNLGVTDPDNGDTQMYSMDCGSYQAYLTMDSTTGNVSFGAGYDLDTGVNPSTFSCNVNVSDGEFTDTAVLVVTINDVNDNVPQFSRPTYFFFISANDGIGTSVGDITASDADAGIYGM
ncbi:hypothetical protein KUTeg_005585 [Tegillarca granosa]|uniref:Cadherin domain-containing protein n=1 Tax=Tegillarca granosa TaxID=220873 RepID=A0ABQ9FNE4_TEGGR|nr:hypothetical protein KUTeg_005585 [Tegillarca granosa]